MDCDICLLSEIHDWCFPRMQAVVHAMYEGDRKRAGQQMEAVVNELADAGFGSDAHLAAEYLLHSQRFAMTRAFCNKQEQQVEFENVVAKLEGRPLGPCSETMQRVILLQVRTIGERLGFREYPPEQFQQHFAGIPASERSDMLWHHVATWAFHHWDQEVLAQAYEALVIQPTDFRDQYPYHRANLMYRLITGRTTTRDLHAFLRRMEIVNEVYEFVKHILPRVHELGLADAELDRLIDETRRRLEQNAELSKG